jgi:nucleoside-diphosphate-sugar epimerase
MNVLICGATGVVGQAAMRYFAAQGADVIAVSRRSVESLPDWPVKGVRALTLDLADEAACSDAIGSLTGITHVVYAALYEKPGLFAGWFEHDQMERNLTMLRNVLEPLTARGGSDLRHVSLLQGTKAHENFYWLQEDYLRDRQAGRPWTFTIWRPQIVFGEAFGSNMNPIPALGVYASLLKADGEPLHWPGGETRVVEAVDTDLIARAMWWATTADAAANETFNITNGDVMVMRNMWPAIAEVFEMELGEDRPLSLGTALPARQADWNRLHQQHDLRSPQSLEAFVGQSFLYGDMATAYGRSGDSPPSLVSTVKLRQAGFADCIDSEDMFRKWFAYFRQHRYLP